MQCPHCDIAITEHEASRCLDAWVAEVVMGWKPYRIIQYNILYPPSRQAFCDEHPVLYREFDPEMSYEFDSEHFYDSRVPDGFTQPIVPAYGTSITDAWEVVEKLNSSGHVVEIVNDCVAWSVRFTNLDSGKKYVSDWKCSLETQICRAALEAKDARSETE